MNGLSVNIRLELEYHPVKMSRLSVYCSNYNATNGLTDVDQSCVWIIRSISYTCGLLHLN